MPNLHITIHGSIPDAPDSSDDEPYTHDSNNAHSNWKSLFFRWFSDFQFWKTMIFNSFDMCFISDVWSSVFLYVTREYLKPAKQALPAPNRAIQAMILSYRHTVQGQHMERLAEQRDMIARAIRFNGPTEKNWIQIILNFYNKYTDALNLREGKFYIFSIGRGGDPTRTKVRGL